MPERKFFYCANEHCLVHSRQPIENTAQELDEHKLCKECYYKGLRLKHGVVVYREKVK